MEFSFSILHISDLHERGPREREPWRRRRVLGEAWVRNIRDLLQDGPIDIVCFTGDLADWGKSAEYEPAGEFLDALLQELHLTRDRLFLVPGNHDIDRSCNHTEWSTVRNNLHRVSSLDVSRWLAGGEGPFGFTDEQREAILARQAAYQAWLQSFGLQTLTPARSHHKRLGYHQPLRLPSHPFDIQIIGLDSAWLAGNDADSGNLRLTDAQVLQLCSDSSGNALPGFRLALVHHPLTDLADGAQCRRLLADHTDILLRGHLHNPEQEIWQDPSRSLRMFAAGCLYEGHLADQYPNACALIRIRCNSSGRPLGYHFRFKSFSERGHWYDDGSLYPNASNGRLLIELVPGQIEHLRYGHIFIGREDQLDVLRLHLLPREGATTPVAICAVQGMPGVGKSYLCDEFYRRNQSQFPGGYLRVALDNVGPISAELVLGKIGDLLSLSGTKAQLESIIRSRLNTSRILLHIENVDGIETARAIALLVSRLRDCPIVISGRFQGLGRTQGWSQILIGLLGEDDAVRQLAGEFREPRDSQESYMFRQLVQRLGCLPLAIHLCAGHLMHSTSISIFLQKLDRILLDLESADPADSVDNSPERKVLRSSFKLSMDLLAEQFGKHSSLSEVPWLLHFSAMGHCPSGGVGAILGSAICGLSVGDFDHLMAQAHALSLTERLESEGGTAARWRVHPLIAEFLRQCPQLPNTGMTGISQWFLSRLPRTETQETHTSAWSDIRVEQNALVEWLDQVQPSEIKSVLLKGTEFARTSGPHFAWKSLCERALLQNPDDETKSQTLWMLCHVLENAGELEDALKRANEKAILDQQRGDLHQATLARTVIARVLAMQGHFAEALQIYAHEALPVFQQVGDERSYATCLACVADIYHRQGKVDESLRILTNEAIPLLQKKGEIRSLLAVRTKVGDILKAQGKYDEALSIYLTEILPACERLEERRGRAVVMSKVAEVYTNQTKYDEAMRIYTEICLPIHEQAGDLREKAIIMSKIAAIYYLKNNFDEMLRVHKEETLPAYQKMGDTHSMAATMGEIAQVYQDRGDYKKALEIYTDHVLPVYEKSEDISAKATTLSHMAELQAELGNPDIGIAILEKEVLPIYEQTKELRLKSISLSRLAELYRDRGNYENALDIFREKVLPACISLSDIRGQAVTNTKIAGILRLQNKYSEALALLQNEALPLSAQFGDQKGRAVILGLMAEIFTEQKKLTEALKIHQEDELPIYRSLGMKIELAHTLGKISKIYVTLGRTEDALKIIEEQELPIYIESGRTASIASALGRKADIFFRNDKLDLALRIREEEELPIYKSLGAKRDELFCRVFIAIILVKRNKRNDRVRASTLLQQAMKEAKVLGLAAEQKTISEIMKRIKS